MADKVVIVYREELSRKGLILFTALRLLFAVNFLTSNLNIPLHERLNHEEGAQRGEEHEEKPEVMFYLRPEVKKWDDLLPGKVMSLVPASQRLGLGGARQQSVRSI